MQVSGQMSGVVAGIDACPSAWVAVRLASSGISVARDEQLEELVGRLDPLDVVAIDMPIGLPEDRRDCDHLARAYVKPRQNSVFAVPPHAVLAESTFERANQRARKLLGGGISQQTWALRKRIEEVGRLADRDPRIIEVHPEVSFRALIDAPVEYLKTTWNGHAVRRQALVDAGIELPWLLDDAGSVPPADVLDAAAAAWSARRYAAGEAEAFPPSAHRGERQVIWY
jgi:predicted RNase H-like nuclease